MESTPSEEAPKHLNHQVKTFKLILLGNTNVGKTCLSERMTRSRFNEHSLPTLTHTFAQKQLTVTKMLDKRGRSMQGLSEMRPQDPPRRSIGEASFLISSMGDRTTQTNGLPEESKEGETDHYDQTSMSCLFKPHQLKIRLNIWDTVGTERYSSMNRQYFTDAVCAVCVYDVTDADSVLSLARWLKMVEESCPRNALKVLVGNKTDLIEQVQVSTQTGKEIAKDKGFDLFFEVSARNGSGVEEMIQQIGQKVADRSSELRRQIEEDYRKFKIEQDRLERLAEHDEDQCNSCPFWFYKK